MTIKDETRFRHLAACIAVSAQQLQLEPITKRTAMTIINLEGWLSELGSLYVQGVTPDCKKSNRTRRQISGGES